MRRVISGIFSVVYRIGAGFFIVFIINLLFRDRLFGQSYSGGVQSLVNAMLKFAFLRSVYSSTPLPEDHDRKLRRAFGRFADECYRSEGARVLEFYYGKNGCFLCDCRPDTERPPMLFLVSGTHIRREDMVSDKVTTHHDSCDFAYDTGEQKQLVQTWRPFRKNEHQLKLVPDFKDGNEQPSPTSSHIYTRSRLAQFQTKAASRLTLGFTGDFANCFISRSAVAIIFSNSAP